jgi:hypothetical protein
VWIVLVSDQFSANLIANTSIEMLGNHESLEIKAGLGTSLYFEHTQDWGCPGPLPPLQPLSLACPMGGLTTKILVNMPLGEFSAKLST